MKLNKDLFYETRSGLDVKLSHTDKNMFYGFYLDTSLTQSDWVPHKWDPDDGKSLLLSSGSMDLIHVPEKVRIEGFIHIFENGAPSFLKERNTDLRNLIAIIYINQNVKKGEGIPITEKQKKEEQADILRRTEAMHSRPDPDLDYILHTKKLDTEEPLVRLRKGVKEKRSAILESRRNEENKINIDPQF